MHLNHISLIIFLFIKYFYFLHIYFLFLFLLFCSLIFPGMASKAFESDIEQFIERTPDGGFTCTQCGKLSSSRSTAKNHVESIHFPSAGYDCDLCGKFLKTKYALYTHNSRYHKK